MVSRESSRIREEVRLPDDCLILQIIGGSSASRGDEYRGARFGLHWDIRKNGAAGDAKNLIECVLEEDGYSWPLNAGIKDLALHENVS
ncbi:hypothetical protein KM043_000392 [Ampulex compressa]|nr:hypothetical protein KM043_000392 [Ampulex compressa]